MDDLLHMVWPLGGSTSYLKWYVNIIVNSELIGVLKIKFICDFPFTSVQ